MYGLHPSEQQATLRCPACGVSRDVNDVIVTVETIEEPGRAVATKKTVRTLISAAQASDRSCVTYTCEVCGHQWDGNFGGPLRISPLPAKEFTELKPLRQPGGKQRIHE